MAKDKALTGAAGAYYVAFQLSGQGYAVGLTTYGTRSIDLAVANPETGKSITIQTKTMFEDAFVQRKLGAFWKWQVGVNALRRPVYKTFFYAFVDLKGNLSQTPDVFIVPSGELRSLLQGFPERVDLESPEVKAVWCDIYEEDAPKYRNNWDILKNALA